MYIILIKLNICIYVNWNVKISQLTNLHFSKLLRDFYSHNTTEKLSGKLKSHFSLPLINEVTGQPELSGEYRIITTLETEAMKSSSMGNIKMAVDEFLLAECKLTS